MNTLRKELNMNALKSLFAVVMTIIAVAAPMHLHGEQKLPLKPHPHLVRWMTERVERLPCWQATHVGPGFTLPNAA